MLMVIDFRSTDVVIVVASCRCQLFPEAKV